MMVKIFDTAMALVAMERLMSDASFAQVAEVLMFFGLKTRIRRVLYFGQMLQLN